MVSGGAFATPAARRRRLKRRRAERAFEAQVLELWENGGGEWSKGYCRAWLLDPGNQTLCEQCGWTLSMVCPECEEGCGCVTYCTGWRHSEYGGGDDDPDWRWGDEEEDPYWYYKLGTICSGCGLYLGSCACDVVTTLQDGTTLVLPGKPAEEERDWHQEWKDDQLAGPPMEEPPDGYYDEVNA